MRPDGYTGFCIEASGENLPISEDCDSKFGIGFNLLPLRCFKPEQPKDFRQERVILKNPHIGRIALIF
jgi:hypothetical protein